MADADGGRADRQALRAAFVNFCTGGRAQMLVAEREGTLLGWGARERGDDCISDLWVAPGAQGRGVGSALLAALEAAIRRDGFAAARLETHAANAGAIGFYERHGYVSTWRGERYAAALGYSIDKVGLSKPLARATSAAGRRNA